MTALKTGIRRSEATEAAASDDHQEGTAGKYSGGPKKASPDQVRMKFRVYRGLDKTRSRKGKEAHPYRPAIHRQREIESIIQRRYGRFLPENDGDEFFVAMVHAIQASGSQDVLADIRSWCFRWAEWALWPRHRRTLVSVSETVRHRRHDLRADAVANLLCVTMAERLALGLRTIGACDVSAAERSKIMANKKKASDRDRQRERREAQGRKSRAEYEIGSLSRTKPWEAEGISRRTWERRRDASMSRVEESMRIGDTLASTADDDCPPRQRPFPVRRTASRKAPNVQRGV
jgi:hypothetical protein